MTILQKGLVLVSQQMALEERLLSIIKEQLHFPQSIVKGRAL